MIRWENNNLIEKIRNLSKRVGDLFKKANVYTIYTIAFDKV